MPAAHKERRIVCCGSLSGMVRMIIKKTLFIWFFEGNCKLFREFGRIIKRNQRQTASEQDSQSRTKKESIPCHSCTYGYFDAGKGEGAVLNGPRMSIVWYRCCYVMMAVYTA